MFMRIDPWNSTGSCGMMEMRERSTSRPILEISTPSMEMEPLAASTILKIAVVSVDLPAPVRPTIPIYKDKLEFNPNKLIKKKNMNE